MNTAEKIAHEWLQSRDATMSTDKFEGFPRWGTMRNSKIAGRGLFAAEFIHTLFVLGISHQFVAPPINRLYHDGWMRRGWAELYNHQPAGQANAVSLHFNDSNILITDVSRMRYPKPGDCKVLVAICDILSGTEITAPYTLYDPSRV